MFGFANKAQDTIESMYPQTANPARGKGGMGGKGGGNVPWAPSNFGGFQQQSRPASPYDMSRPGHAENAFMAAAPQFQQPGAGRPYQEQAAQQLQQPGQAQSYYAFAMPGIVQSTGASNPLAQAIQSFQSNRPELAQDPGLSPFYDTAKRRALESIDANTASRGAYGSSAALNQGTEAIATLEADRAAKEADYRLRTSAENRAWEQLGGDLAQGYDASRQGWAGLGGVLSAGADASGRGRAEALGNIGSTMGQEDLLRLQAWMNAASIAQNAREGRIQGGFDNLSSLGSSMFPQVAGFSGDAFDEYMALLDAELQGGLGGANAGATFSAGHKAQNDQALKDLFELIAAGGGG